MKGVSSVEIEAEVSHQERANAREVLADTLAARVRQFGESARGGRVVGVQVLEATFEPKLAENTPTYWSYRVKVRVAFGDSPRRKALIVLEALLRVSSWFIAACRTAWVSLSHGVELVTGVDADPKTTAEIVRLGETLVEKLDL
jgi:hypothetical protein